MTLVGQRKDQMKERERARFRQKEEAARCLFPQAPQGEGSHLHCRAYPESSIVL